MKQLTRISLLAFGLTAVAFPAFSAEGDAPTDRPRRPLLRALVARHAARQAQALRRLDLTADQISQLKAKRANTANALRAIRADSSLTREQKMAKAREVGQAARSEIRALLTPEQQAKLDQMRERSRAAHRPAGAAK